MALLLPALPDPQSFFDYHFFFVVFIRPALACNVPLAYKVTTCSEDTERLLVMSGLTIINIMNVKATRFD